VTTEITVLRQPLFVVQTPYPATPKVVCFKDTWERKFVPAGRVQQDTKRIVISTLEKPSAICLGTSNPGYLAFVNASDVSQGSGHPYVVFVDPNANLLPTVASIGPRREYKDLKEHTILWLPES